MSKLSILVVEDDPLSRKVMESRLAGHAVDLAGDATTGKRLLQRGRYDVAFLDLKLGDESGCSGLELIPLASGAGAYTVVMSGHDTDKHVEEAYSRGCDDFYAKGNEDANIEEVLARCRQKRAGGEDIFEERFVTTDAALRARVAEALKYAPADLPILILGPSGTGKTSLARVIHDRSGRQGDFVAINCSAYTEDLLEAELFGYKKGAFTGAVESRKGKLLAADGGTLFLDEIGSMSLKMQTKLLKAIEEKTFFPLGSDTPETSRFRIVSATLEDLQGLIKEGKLRFDFYQRIHGLTVKLTPLSERKADVLPLISSFTRSGKRLALSSEAKARLLAHDWPGNVRELKKLVELLSAGEGGRVSADDVERLLGAIRVEEGPRDFATEDQYHYAKRHGLDAAVDRLVDELVQRSLAENEGKKTQVLEALKISTRLLYASLRRRPNP